MKLLTEVIENSFSSKFSGDPLTVLGLRSLCRDCRSLPEEFLDHLLTSGVTLEEVDTLLSLGKPNPVKIQNRMNFFGTLHGSGYSCPRQYPRRITGYTPPVAPEGFSDWSRDQQEAYHDLFSQPELHPQLDEEWVREALWERHSEWLHELSWMYYPTYLVGASSKVFRYDGPSGEKFLIQRKFENRPRLTIHCFKGSWEFFYTLAKQIGPLSTTPVVLEFLPPDLLPLVRLNGLKLNYEQEILYDLKSLLENPKDHFSASERTSLHKSSRDTIIRELDFTDSLDLDLARQVIDTWRSLNSSRHRRLAIIRDYQCLETPSTGRVGYLGLRDGHPCILGIYDRLSGTANMMGDLVGKSLNYSSVPGGRYGTADFALVEIGRHLLDRGIDYVNAGRMAGGELTLKAHKLRRGMKYLPEVYMTTTPFSRKENHK